MEKGTIRLSLETFAQEDNPSPLLIPYTGKLGEINCIKTTFFLVRKNLCPSMKYKIDRVKRIFTITK